MKSDFVGWIDPRDPPSINRRPVLMGLATPTPLQTFTWRRRIHVRLLNRCGVRQRVLPHDFLHPERIGLVMIVATDPFEGGGKVKAVIAAGVAVTLCSWIPLRTLFYGRLFKNVLAKDARRRKSCDSRHNRLAGVNSCGLPSRESWSIQGGKEPVRNGEQVGDSS